MEANEHSLNTRNSIYPLLREEQDNRGFFSIVSRFRSDMKTSDNRKMMTIGDFNKLISKRKYEQLPHSLYKICQFARLNKGFQFGCDHHDSRVVKCVAMAVFSHMYFKDYKENVQNVYKFLVYMLFIRPSDFEFEDSLTCLQKARKLLSECGGHKGAELDLCEQMHTLSQIPKDTMTSFDDVQEEFNNDLVYKLLWSLKKPPREKDLDKSFAHFARDKLPSIVFAYKGHFLFRGKGEISDIASIPWND